MRGLYTNGLLRVLRLSCSSVRTFVWGMSWVSKQDSYKFNHMLRQCEGSIKCIYKIHGKIIIEGHGHNVFVGSKLISMYSELGQFNIKDGRKVFDNMSERDVFLWNMMIQAYANSGPFEKALNMYWEMCQHGVLADKYTFTFVLKALGIMNDETTGRVIHGHALKHGFGFDLFVGNALVALYAKCQVIEASRRVFEEIPQKDLVSWNSIISGYASNGHANEALVLFYALLRDDSLRGPDHATLVTILPACAQAAEIQLGFWIHWCIIKKGFPVDTMLGSGLIAMYGNCGRLDYARRLFDQISERNIIVWNAMIRGYGMHGNAKEALNLYSKFLKDGLRPDGVMFLCLLSTCSHAGMLAKGHEIFKKMEDYGIEKGNEHYACMADLLGRAGLVTEAVELVKTMPMTPGKDVYGALLGACKMHNNVEVAEVIAEKLFALDPNGGGRYVTLATIYGDGGRLRDAAKVRKMMVKKKIKKDFGFSSVEVDCVLHRFGSDDETHVRTMEIFEILSAMDNVMAEEF